MEEDVNGLHRYTNPPLEKGIHDFLPRECAGQLSPRDATSVDPSNFVRLRLRHRLSKPCAKFEHTTIGPLPSPNKLLTLLTRSSFSSIEHEGSDQRIVGDGGYLLGKYTEHQTSPLPASNLQRRLVNSHFGAAG